MNSETCLLLICLVPAVVPVLIKMYDLLNQRFQQISDFPMDHSLVMVNTNKDLLVMDLIAVKSDQVVASSMRLQHLFRR